jgi:hypothetical protein
MRIDEIDLFGPMLVNGSTGSNGQVFGFSGSEITWITASSSGGDGSPGPQGPVGIGLFIPQDQIAIGGPSGLTSTSFFRIFNNNIIHGSSSVSGSYNTILGSHQFVTPSSYANNIYGISDYNTIIGGYSNTVSGSVKSFMGGGRINNITNQCHSAMLGGSENSISTSNFGSARNNTILGSCNSAILGTTCITCGNTILGGYTNTLGVNYTSVYYSSIVASENSFFSSNIISVGYTGVVKNSVIIGGNVNVNYGTLYCNYQNAIIGGCNNCLSDSQGGFVLGTKFTNNSVTIASCNTSMRSSRSVIVSSTGELSLFNCQDPFTPLGSTRGNQVLFTRGRVGNYSMFCAYTNANSTFLPGTFFNRINGKGNCFVVYCGFHPFMYGKKLTICF